MHRNLATVEADLALRRAPAGGWRGRTGWDGSNSHRSRVAKRPPNLALRRGEHQIADLPPPSRLLLIQRLRSVNAFRDIVTAFLGENAKIVLAITSGSTAKKRAVSGTIGEWRQL